MSVALETFLIGASYPIIMLLVSPYTHQYVVVNI